MSLRDLLNRGDSVRPLGCAVAPGVGVSASDAEQGLTDRLCLLHAW